MENEELWKNVKEYIKYRYEMEKLGICISSPIGELDKKGIKILENSFVLNEFYLEKYKKKLLNRIKVGERDKWKANKRSG